MERLLRPSRIAVFGGDWAANVVEQCQRGGFTGEIWPVHPERTQMAGVPCIPSVDELPGVPDACFIAINREATVELVSRLAQMGAGGAVCFAAGFSEASHEDPDATQLQAQLIEAADQMPILGPNCYGYINYLDSVVLWPDQHGGQAVSSGVGVISQSSNIAVNLSMQQRGLPLAYLMTAGNQAGISLGELGDALLLDERVTAIGLHIEGFGDIRTLESMAKKARAKGIPVVALKVGRNARSRAATLSHTRAMAGNTAASDAFLDRLGIVRVSTLSVFLETLKLLHVAGPRIGRRLLSMSCSGGEAALVADTAEAHGLQLPALDESQTRALRDCLGPRVALANPLDYNTHIWNDPSATRAMVRAALTGEADIALLVLDIPRDDRCDASPWIAALDAFVEASEGWSGVRVVVSTLGEGLPENVSLDLMRRGVIGLGDLDDAFAAIAAASGFRGRRSSSTSEPVWLPDPSANVFVLKQIRSIESSSRPTPTPLIGRSGDNVASIHSGARRDASPIGGPNHIDEGGGTPSSMPSAWQGAHPQDSIHGGAFRMLDESTAKRWLMRFGTVVPRGLRLSFADVRSPRRLSAALDKLSPVVPWPVVVKGLGVAHKSESNAIVLNIDNRRELELAIKQIDCAGGCLIEEQMLEGVAELLVSVVQDPVHGLLLSVGAGGVLSELLDDVAHALLPIDRTEINALINQLRCAPMLSGFRNQPVVDRELLVDAVDSIQQAALKLGERLLELEINPLICSAESCVAVDALVTVRDVPGSENPLDD